MPDMAEATITEYAVDDPNYAELARTVLDTATLDVVAHAAELWMRGFLKQYEQVGTTDERKLELITEAFLNTPKHIVRYGLEEVIHEVAEYDRKLARREKIPHLVDHESGHVYAIVDGEMCSMPLHIDGSWDWSELSSIEFHMISDEEAERPRRAEKALKEMI